MKAATALEVFQNWALIHDDIEDDSEMRRGEPCLHKIYGVPLAINAGDALHVKMWEVLLDNKELLGSELTFRILDKFKRLCMETVEGQAIEINWVTSGKYNLREEDYYKMAGRKTSWYTIITPFRVGALIAGADEKIVDGLIDFGWKLGIAFQIQDDLLNLIGEEKKYGKEIGGDIAEGKRTLMLINLLNVCNKGEKENVIRVLNKDRSAKSNKEIKFVIDLMKKIRDHRARKAKSQRIRLRKQEDTEQSNRTTFQITYDCRDHIRTSGFRHKQRVLERREGYKGIQDCSIKLCCSCTRLHLSRGTLNRFVGVM